MTKIVLVGIADVLPEILFGDEQASNIRRLMDVGTYGPLLGLDGQSPVDAWLTLAYGRKLDMDYPPKGSDASYESLHTVIESRSELLPIWDVVADTGGDSLLIIPASTGASSFSKDPAYSIKKEAGGLVRDLVDQASGDQLRRPATHLSSDQASAGIVLPADRVAYQVFHARFLEFEGYLRIGAWAYSQVIDNTLDRLLHHMTSDSSTDEILSEYIMSLDEELGKILEVLDDDTIFALVSLCAAAPTGNNPGDPAGAYVIAGPNCPARSEPMELNLVDLAPTLLAAIGCKIPSSMLGTPRFEPLTETQTYSSELSAQELEFLRERLSGLGYIG